jgi:hypothetical protein
LAKHKIALFRLVLAFLAMVLAADVWKDRFIVLRISPKLFSLLFLTVGASLTEFQGIRWDRYILNQLELAYLLPLAPI